jgi:thiol-disulfide isomerase/thioredoxin
VTLARRAEVPQSIAVGKRAGGTVGGVASRRLPLPWLVGATIAALLAATAVVVFAGGDDSADSADVPTPAEVKALVVTSLDSGADSRIDDLLTGKPVVLNLFASWCTGCIREMPAFERVHQDLGDDVSFVGLALRNPRDDAQALVEQTGVTYPTYTDEADEAFEMFGVVALPTTVFLDADGTVRDIHLEIFTEDQLRAEIGEQFGVGV